ncbi:MAG TPA: DUF433 domain-containing protein [Rhizomicrobium sp.]|nr:DUF433 domain-containing protein [Rhizomicrobium sp.]
MTILLDRISIDPGVCGGKPCIKGTRIWVSLILDNLADGMTEAGLLEQYPQLAPDDIHAAKAFASPDNKAEAYEWVRQRRDARPGVGMTSVEILRGPHEDHS